MAQQHKRLIDYLIGLSEDPREREKYFADKDRALAESGLADHHQKLLGDLDNVHQEIQRAVHEEDQDADLTQVPLLAQYMVSHVVAKGPPWVKKKKHH